MARSYISATVRKRIRDRAGGVCEYCHYPDHACYAPFHCDHCLSRSGGGLTLARNLAWACPYCNGSKGGDAGGFDPATRKTVRLFNPRVDRWTEHFQWAKGGLLIHAITAQGRATIVKLKMNRPSAIEIRRLLLILGEHPLQLEEGSGKN